MFAWNVDTVLWLFTPMLFCFFPYSASAMWHKIKPQVAVSAVISFCLLATFDVTHASNADITTSNPQLLQPPTVPQNVTTPASNAEYKKYVDDDFMKVSQW